MKAHPYAELFPMLTDDELQVLAADIKVNGQREDITTLDGMILDGRNRYRACEIAGVEPMMRGYLGDNPLAFVLSSNLHRRHLTESQRSAVAAKIANMRQGERTDLEPSANLPKVSQAEAADLLNVSERSVRSAKSVVENGTPELVAAVDAGQISVNAAAEVAKLPKEEQKKIVAKGPDAVKKAAKKAKAERKAKPETKPEPVSQPEPADKDSGTGVQTELIKQIETVCRELDRLKATVESWKEHKEAYAVHFPTIVEGIARVRSDLWGSRLSHGCPYCEKKPSDDCKACRGTRKVVKFVHTQGARSMNRYGGVA